MLPDGPKSRPCWMLQDARDGSVSEAASGCGLVDLNRQCAVRLEEDRKRFRLDARVQAVFTGAEMVLPAMPGAGHNASAHHPFRQRAARVWTDSSGSDGA